MPSDKAIDLVCLGRAGVDFYAEQVGSRLEDVGSFAKYIGGSSTNIACCSSRMGLRSALITRVGDEHMGQFIREQLQREGVDTRCVVTDPERLTALVVLGIKDQDTFPLIFYRENCADMAVDIADIDHGLIESSKALLITGTHFSTEQVYRTSKHALSVAADAGVKRVLDIDYRPVLWGLTSKGDGETRFIASESVTAHLQSILAEFDLIVGTEEEIHIAGGDTNTVQAMRNIRAVSDAVLVLKRGPFGASVYEGDIPDNLDDGVTVEGVTVRVLNVLGAGDAFISGFLRGWINGEGYEQALRYANACGALVVSRHGCTPAMPTREELDYFLANSAAIPRPDIDSELNYLHRVTVSSESWAELNIHAFDHRIQFEEMADAAGVGHERVQDLKALLYRATQQVIDEQKLAGKCGILCDDRFGPDVLNEATGSGLWIARPVELPRSRPLQFEGGRSIGSLLESWPLEHKVKCLVYYSAADEAGLRAQQEQKLIELYDACCQSGHQLLLEVIPPVEELETGESVYRSLQRLFELGIRPDWWKLPCMTSAWAEKTNVLVAETTPHCYGIVILGLDAKDTELAEGFKAFRGLPLVRGFAVGRTIFCLPAKAWLAGELDDAGLIAEVAANYTRMTEIWKQAMSG
ncbi:5-dehydro-2-deoxygluconokinase [Chromatiales bacterium (ex Bugula neritina AB1)]|nr:5-dehydro-2-deoxygluconokinase [Chromatiales bacterium (ex Bugula neritina AB1)]